MNSTLLNLKNRTLIKVKEKLAWGHETAQRKTIPKIVSKEDKARLKLFDDSNQKFAKCMKNWFKHFFKALLLLFNAFENFCYFELFCS